MPRLCCHSCAISTVQIFFGVGSHGDSVIPGVTYYSTPNKFAVQNEVQFFWGGILATSFWTPKDYLAYCIVPYNNRQKGDMLSKKHANAMLPGDMVIVWGIWGWGSNIPTYF